MQHTDAHFPTNADANAPRRAARVPRFAFRFLRSKRASVIIVVLVMMAFAAMAMAVFMDKASNDLLVEKREVDASHMRLEAYSAMETVLATLEDYRSAIGTLHSPAEGWNDPLGFAGYSPTDTPLIYYGIDPTYTVQVSFEDESGKLSLPNVTSTTLTNLFTYWGIDTNTTAKLVDALLGWMKKDYVPSSAGAPQPSDYEAAALPFDPPGRTLRSFDELASINFVRDIFYDEDGRPNDYYRRFVSTFSLYNFSTTNINAAAPDVMGALGSQDPAADKKLADFLSGADNHAPGGAPGWFGSTAEIATFLGGDSPATAMGVTISALRVIVTVRQGPGHSYRLNALVSMPGGGGAKIPSGWSQLRSPYAVVTSNTTSAGGVIGVNSASVTTAANSTAANSSGASQAVGVGGGTSANSASAAVQNLQYPYTFLEVRENDVVPPPGPMISGGAPVHPPAPPAAPTGVPASAPTGISASHS